MSDTGATANAIAHGADRLASFAKRETDKVIGAFARLPLDASDESEIATLCSAIDAALAELDACTAQLSEVDGQIRSIVDKRQKYDFRVSGEDYFAVNADGRRRMQGVTAQWVNALRVGYSSYGMLG